MGMQGLAERDASPPQQPRHAWCCHHAQQPTPFPCTRALPAGNPLAPAVTTAAAGTSTATIQSYRIFSTTDTFTLRVPAPVEDVAVSYQVTLKYYPVQLDETQARIVPATIARDSTSVVRTTLTGWVVGQSAGRDWVVAWCTHVLAGKCNPSCVSAPHTRRQPAYASPRSPAYYFDIKAAVSSLNCNPGDAFTACGKGR